MQGRFLWISERVQVRASIGMPQGSPLSCTLSNLFLRDLISTLKQEGSIPVNYADDTNVVKVATRSTDSLLTQATEVTRHLQETLGRVVEWARSAGAQLNVLKTQFALLLPGKNRFEGTILQKVEFPGVEKTKEPRILGVVNDRFSLGGKHVQDRIKITNPRAGGLSSLVHVGLEWMRKLYVGGVRPSLIYGVESFSALAETSFAKLERFQLKCLKHMGRLRDGTPSAVVGRLFRVPPIRLVIMSRWMIRDGVSREDARKWVSEEWDRCTPLEHRIEIADRGDAVWQLERAEQCFILRARSGFTLVQSAENREQLCQHPYCMDGECVVTVEHILLECHRFTSRRAGLRAGCQGSFTVKNILWPVGPGSVDILRRTARFLMAIKA